MLLGKTLAPVVEAARCDTVRTAKGLVRHITFCILVNDAAPLFGAAAGVLLFLGLSCAHITLVFLAGDV